MTDKPLERSGMYPLALPALTGQPNTAEDRVKFYTVELPAEVAATFHVDRAITGQDGEGFQRALDETRARRIGEAMASDFVVVHGGLLAYADPDQVELSKSGPRRLVIKEPLAWLDGQHRGAGARTAMELGASHYTETVKIAVGLTKFERVKNFLTINIQARKVGPGTTIYDISQMEGTHERRKSWIARLVVGMSMVPPFKEDEENAVSLVNFGGGRVQPVAAATLYRVIDTLLPDRLNKEGQAIEADAAQFAHVALSLYADLWDNWGDTTENGSFVASDAYGFTMMLAYAKLFNGVDGDEKLIRKAFELANLKAGIGTIGGSGERAANSLAAMALSKVGVATDRVLAATAA